MDKDYKSQKWEKRKNKILSYKKMYSDQIAFLNDPSKLPDFSDEKICSLLKLSYANIVELDYINEDKVSFQNHINDLLQNASLCCKAFKDGKDMHESLSKPISDGLKSGYEGYYALIVQDEEALFNVTNEDHPLRKMLDHKRILNDSDRKEELFDMINAIIDNDSELFNKALKDRIVSIRKMPVDYTICFDVWSAGLIIYAEKQGMNVDRDKFIEADLNRIGL